MSHTVFISDLHIQSNSDKGSLVLEYFFKHREVRTSERIIFLGDIFDYASGFHIEYTKRFKIFYEGLIGLLKEGKEVYYFEGNHDLHLEKLHRHYINRMNCSNKLYFHIKKDIEVNWYDQKLRISHGDDIQIDQPIYSRYKKIIGSIFAEFLANNLLTLKFVDYLGGTQSRKSRNRRGEFNLNKMEESYLEGLKRFVPYFDIVIAGHAHHFKNTKIKNMQYFNIGFPIKDKKFLKLSEDGVDIITLEV